MSAACMGGWCVVRESCRRFNAEGVSRLRPIERMCDAGTLSDFSPYRDITFRPQSEAPTRANSVFDLARSMEAA